MDLLDGGEVVAKGRVLTTDPKGTIHSQPIPAGYLGVTVLVALKGETYIPYPPPHDPDYNTLEKVVGWIIAWPSAALAVCISGYFKYKFAYIYCLSIYIVQCLYLQAEGVMAERSHSRSGSRSGSRSHSRSHHRSHSRRSHSSSSSSSQKSKFSDMSEEDFESEAKKRGWVKNDNSEATSKKKEGGGSSCFGDCFGNKKKDAQHLETVMEEEGDDYFEFRPHTQLQFEEPQGHRGTQDTTDPSTPQGTMAGATGWTPIPTGTNTPVDTPTGTPRHER